MTSYPEELGAWDSQPRQAAKSSQMKLLKSHQFAHVVTC